MKEKDSSFLKLFNLLIFGFSIVIIVVTIITLLLYAKSKGNEMNTIRDTSLLQSTANEFDSIIKQYHEVSIQLTSSPALRRFVLLNYHSPGKNNSDTISTLAIARHQHSYLASIWLYDVRSGDVVNDMYVECPLADSIYYGIIQGYLNGSLAIEKLRYNGWFTSIFWYNEQLYIARDFPTFGENRLGILFVELDIKAILRDQRANNLLYDQLIVFDANKQIISPLSTMSPTQTNSFSDMFAENISFMEKGTAKHILVKSELTGWYYGGVSPRFEVFSSDIILIIGILILTFFVISTIFSNYIFSIFVSPLRALAQSSRGFFDVTDKSEIKAISKSLLKATQSLKEYNTAISSISSHLSESFFNDLYDGKPMSLNYIQTALNILDCMIDLSGFYWVIVINYKDYFDSSFPNLIYELTNKCLSNLNINPLKFHISPYPDQTIILLELSLKLGKAEADVYRKYIFKNIEECLLHLPINMSIGIGSIVYLLTNIHASIASANLNRKSVDQVSISEIPVQATTSDLEADLEKNKIALFVKRLFKLVDDNQLWQAEEDLNCQIDSNSIDAKSPEEFRDICRQLINVVWEYAVNDGISPNMLFDEACEQIKKFEEISSEEVRNKTLQICLSCLKEKQCSNKSHHHLRVQAAKKYIAQHFCKQDLSLRDIADAIDTSPSYLSKMFKSYEGISFVEYLNSMRVEHAKELLRDSNMSIKDIAFKSGFLTEQNFFRVFKRIINATPKQYRDAPKKQKHN